jgi:uroporphyrinogen-III decarboxylase
LSKLDPVNRDVGEQPSAESWFTVADELAIKSLTVNFLPSWWHKNYKVSFGEKYIFDPDYRVETARFMSRTINKHFPDLHIGLKNPQPEVIMPNLINASDVALAGGEVFYPEDNYPWSRHLQPEAIEKLKLPENIEEVFPFNEGISQVKYLNNKLNKDVKPFLYKNGILNASVLIMGDELLLDLACKNGNAKKVLDYNYEMWVKTMDYNYKVHSFPSFVMIPNCTVIMVGPARYEESLFSYDLDMCQYLNKRNQKFMLHHCGNFDHFIKSYRRIPYIDMLQIGYESNIRAALEVFPEADVEYIFDTFLLLHGSRSEIRDKTNEILESTHGNWDRFSMVVADIDQTSPDENLLEIYECCKKAAV